jgi:Ca2+-binding EF-hand superfamily protein
MMHTILLTFSKSTLKKLPNLQSQGLASLQSRGLSTISQTSGLHVPQTTIPQNVQSLFSMLDLDSNGVLDKSEFFAATSKLNLNLSEGEWNNRSRPREKWLRDLGKLATVGTCRLYFVLTHRSSAPLCLDDTEQLFKKLDVNNDGVLTCDEFSDIELSGKLFTLSGLQHFMRKHIGGKKQQEMATPGRWTLGIDKFEKESKKVKQYYD